MTNKNSNVDRSFGVHLSYGVNRSDGVNGSNGVNSSLGVNGSNGVNNSHGVNRSDGVNFSFGVLNSHGVNNSYGVNFSFGVLNSHGVDNALFLADKERTYSIFGQAVRKERFNEVRNKLYNKLNGWFPKFNNAFELYRKNGNNWEKVDASEICSTLDSSDEPYEAWKDMPKEAIEYVKSLPEFDAEMFKRITGIDVEANEKTITIEGKKWTASELKKRLNE